MAKKKIVKRKTVKAKRIKNPPPSPEPAESTIKFEWVGQLDFEFETWTSAKKKRFPKFGNLTVIFADPEAGGPNKEQLKALEKFKASAERMRIHAQKALVEFYNEWARQDDLFPPLKRDQDVWKTVKLDEIRVPPSGSKVFVCGYADWCDRSLLIKLEKSKGHAGQLAWFFSELDK